MSYLSKIADGLKGSDGEGTVKVLIVEDEELVAEMFRTWLSDAGCTVEVANGGEEALKKIDGSFDVALLDRRMPLITGDELLDLFRSEDIDDLDPEMFELRDVRKINEEYEQKCVDDFELKTAKKLNDKIVERLQREEIDCQICMVSAVEPDLGIVNMDFDHYVVKDVTESRLVQMVESLASLSELDDNVRKYQSLRWKMFLLEEKFTKSELEDKEEYQELKDAIKKIEEEGGSSVQKVKDIDFK